MKKNGLNVEHFEHQLRKLVAQVRPVGRMSLEPWHTMEPNKWETNVLKKLPLSLRSVVLTNPSWIQMRPTMLNVTVYVLNTIKN